MKLRKLISDLSITVYSGGQDVEILGICTHSKSAAPGHLFVARKGAVYDGSKYIDEALSAGAVAILTDMPDPFLKRVTQLIHPTPGSLEAILAARFYGFPSRSLDTIGITGTNGKTTTSYLIKHFLDHLQRPCGLIGTIEYIVGDHRFPAERTSPDAATTQKLLREMVKQGETSLVMEVVSHALVQGRCDHITYQTAIFTNLSHDHLDYHKTMQAYCEAKSLLFTRLEQTAYAVVNGDSPWTESILSKCQAKVFTYGLSSPCDLFADEIVLSPTETRCRIHYRGESLAVRWHLIGRHNIYNCLAALAACLVRGISLSTLIPLLDTLPFVAGRLEKVPNQQGYQIFVDYAHTPDALEKVLCSLQEIKEPGSKIITVFGCGGDRDRGKRPEMGRIAEEKSDIAIITSDNPRSESPELICDEIAAGCQSVLPVIYNRREAIAYALSLASSKDLILIAGKGHEAYQVFSHQTIPFDDREVAKECLERVLL